MDLFNLVTAPLPNLPELDEVDAFGAAANDAASRIAYAINADPVRVRTRLAELLKVSDPQELAEQLELHEGELVYLAYTDPEFASAVASTAETSAVRPAVDTAGVSTSLAEVLSA